MADQPDPPPADTPQTGPPSADGPAAAARQAAAALGHKDMSFGDHLEDLRRRLVLGILGVVPIFVLSLAFGRQTLAFMIRPIRDQLRALDLPSSLTQTGPLETFNTYLQISLIVTVLFGSPWLLYQLWRFVAPGLYRNERRFVHLLVPLSSALTMSSFAFLYWVVLPVVLGFFIRFGTQIGQTSTPTAEVPPGFVLPQAPVFDGDPPEELWTPGAYWVNTDLNQLRVVKPGKNSKPRAVGADLTQGAGITQFYRVKEYVGTVLNLALAFGVAFQTPIVVLLLGYSGIVDRAWFIRYRRYALAVAVVLGAVLTPADPISMLLLAIPLYGLFELGLLLLWIFKPSYERFNEQSQESTPIDDGRDAER